MHPPTQRLIAHREFSLLQRRVATKVTSDAVALATPSRVGDGLPNCRDIYGHLLRIENTAVAWLVHELEWRVGLVAVANAVAEVDVDGISDGGAAEDRVVEVLAEFGLVESCALFDRGV